MISSDRIDDIARGNLAKKRMSRDFRVVLYLTLIHIPLGVVIYNAGSLALLHPIGAFGVGLYWAMKRHVRIERVALAMAYIVSAEVLWRMGQVPIFWEFGKYGSAAIAIVALVRRNHYVIPKVPVVYFAALLPACILTFIELDSGGAQAILSSTMSGPFFLFISCWFFSFVRMTSQQLSRLFFAIIIPLLSVACATLFYTVATEDIQFTGESNLATSGGFGPNQVSSMLGLGAFAAFLCLIVFRHSIKFRIYFMLAALFFSAQSVLTFSRGGMYNAVGAILIVSIVQFRGQPETAKRLVPIAALAILFLAFVFPFLNNFTGGSLQERFEDTGTTNRSEIAQADLQIFLENPVTGIGVGLAYESRERFLGRKAVSHTEFARLLSEHGLFGLVSIFSLMAMVILNFKRQRSVLGHAVVAGAAVWCGLLMVNAGMRMAAPSFIWGLTFVTIVIPRQRQVIARAVQVKRKTHPPKLMPDGDQAESEDEL